VAAKMIQSICNKFLLGDSALETIKVLLEYFLKYRKYDAMPSLRKGFASHAEQYIPTETCERIVSAYHKAKESQKSVPSEYQVGIRWQRELDEKAFPLIEALSEKKVPKLQKLFANQQREEYGQSWGGYSDLHNLHHKPFYKYEFINTWYNHYKVYREIVGDSYPLSYPLVGNPVGLFYNDMVIPIEAIMYHYVSSQQLALVEGIESPVICEIGGGQGGQAYAMIKNADRHNTYINLDIPEILALASYFLCAAFPEKRILLFGEGDVSTDYDIILLPNFCLRELKDESIDLFFNQRSFPEMDKATVDEYLKQIGRACSRYFYHINYNNPSKDPYGLKYVQATEVLPDPSLFKLVTQMPWYFNKLNNRVRAVYIAFLYERLSHD